VSPTTPAVVVGGDAPTVAVVTGPDTGGCRIGCGALLVETNVSTPALFEYGSVTWICPPVGYKPDAD